MSDQRRDYAIAKVSAGILICHHACVAAGIDNKVPAHQG